jgi:hypothetical protein
MSLAKGIRGKGRKELVTQHRITKFEEAFDSYLRGEVSADYLHQRGEKLKSIRKGR